MTRKLTAATRKPEGRTDADIFDLPDGPGWGFGGPALTVRGTDRRWNCKAVLNGRTITVQLGTAAELPTVRQAKERFEEARTMAARGLDPNVAIKAGRKGTPTFGQAAKEFMDDYVPTLKNAAHRAKWRQSIENHCKPLWSVKVEDIRTADILATLKPIWKKVPVMASEVRSRIEVIIDDAIVKNYRNNENNPARWTLQLQRSLGGKPPKSGETRGAQRSIAPEDMPAFMTGLIAEQHPTARALAAIALTGMRSQEFVQMRLRELSLDADEPTWTVPKMRFKVDPHGKDFVVPLAPQLVRILRDQIKAVASIHGEHNVDYIWPTMHEDSKQLWISSGTMLMYLKRAGHDATVHGFRASFKTWANAQFADGTTATPKYHPHAVEFCLAHTNPSGGTVEHRYSRDQMMLPARRGIMADWADFCLPRERLRIAA
jgi:integrase